MICKRQEVDEVYEVDGYILQKVETVHPRSRFR